VHLQYKAISTFIYLSLFERLDITKYKDKP